MKVKEVLFGGITNNPVFILVLGICPVLAMSTTLEFAFWLGVSTTVVLLIVTVIISLLRNIIPDKVRIPCYIMITATAVTVVDMFLAKFIPSVYSNLGSFIKLIATNCIIFARIESFANSNKPHMAALDAVSMGLGFIFAMCLLGAVREVLGKGAILGHQFIKIEYNGAVLSNFISVFSTAAGGFIVFGLLMAIFNHVYTYFQEKIKLKEVGASATNSAIDTASSMNGTAKNETPADTDVKSDKEN